MFEISKDIKIYRINIGPDPLSGMGYYVGQKLHAGRGEDKIMFALTRIIRESDQSYLICARNIGSDSEFIFRHIENMPVYITPVIPGTAQEQLVDYNSQKYDHSDKHLSDSSG